MKLAIDLHDTITYHPNFFRELIKNWKDKVYILTGTPLSRREEVVDTLQELRIEGYHEILLGFEYSKENMDEKHFQKMKEHKLKLIKENEIEIYFDDNPVYVEYVRNHGILVLQPILSDEYIDKFSKRDKYFTCHLQKNQFKNVSKDV